MSQSLHFVVSSSRSPNLSLPNHSYLKLSPPPSNLRYPVTFVRRPISASSSDLDSNSPSKVLVSDNGKGGVLPATSPEYVPPPSDSSSIDVDAVTEADLKENGFRSTRRTKLVCTIGPATCGFEQLEALAVGGMNVARINMCHGTREWHRRVIECVRRLNEEKGFAVAIMMDTEGSEIHMGELGGAPSAKAEDGEIWTFSVRAFDSPRPERTINVNYDGFTEDVKVGDELLVDGGMVRFDVIEKIGPDVKCRCTDPGLLLPRANLTFWRDGSLVRERNAMLPTISSKEFGKSVLLKQTVDLLFRNVLVKGGDLPSSLDAVDIFFDGDDFYELRSSRIKTRNTHGTGCTLASCIAAELAKGSQILSAVKAAKHYIETALDYSKDIAIGNGFQGPFDHLLKLKSNIRNSFRKQAFNPANLFLYAVTDSGMNKKWGRSITEAVKAAIEGGATIVQLREKDAETRDFLEAAKACVEICHSHGVSLLINDRLDVALACDADGVHVGQSDIPARVVRTLLGPEKIIGVSCKTPEQAEKAWIDGADYIGCGGVYPTNTKANNITVGLDGLKTVCLASKLPVVAIGGINASNARTVMEIGVPNLKGVAVVSALFDRECVLTETQKLHGDLTQAAAMVK